MSNDYSSIGFSAAGTKQHPDQNQLTDALFQNKTHKNRLRA
jgi:hypothetical protein